MTVPGIGRLQLTGPAAVCLGQFILGQELVRLAAADQPIRIIRNQVDRFRQVFAGRGKFFERSV